MEHWYAIAATGADVCHMQVWLGVTILTTNCLLHLGLGCEEHNGEEHSGAVQGR